MWLNFSSRSVSSVISLLKQEIDEDLIWVQLTNLFRTNGVQYRANSSGDFVGLLTVCVTALLKISLAQT